MFTLYLSLFSCLCFAMCRAHIRLTWPPPREYSLDWLDNSRSPPPCGMPAGPVMTTFKQEATFNITWHMAIAHTGGYKIELLQDAEVLYNFTNGFISANDITSQTYKIQLPDNFTCANCTLRIVRQALNYGPHYQFWSCADITIAKDHSRDCQYNGRLVNGKCQCNPLYRGDSCQYMDECDVDSDCSQHGICVTTDSTFYPKMQCFCSAGWFGDKCEKKSEITEIDIDYDDYNIEEFAGGDFKLFWKIIEESSEIEIGMKSKGESYAAIGMRPKLMDSCSNFASPYSNSEPGSEGGKAEPEGTTPSQGGKAEPEGTTASQGGKAEPEGTTPSQGGKAEPEGTTPSQGGKAEPEGTTPSSQGGKAEPEGTTASQGGKAEPEGTTASQGGDAEPEGTTAASQGIPEPENSTPAPEGKPKPKGPSHAMDCTDIVLGTAIGTRSRIGDFYTRDRSSPRKDSFYSPGGTNSLTSAIGAHANGYTTILFRRKLLASELQDHTIIRGKMHVIWARGQMPSYTLKDASDPQFYKKYEIKYHGRGTQRGFTDIDFYRNSATAGAADSFVKTTSITSTIISIAAFSMICGYLFD